MMLLISFIGAFSFKIKTEKEIQEKIEYKNYLIQLENERIELRNKTINSFKGNIINKYNVDERIINTINKYLNNYFESMYYLEEIDNSSLFDNDYYLKLTDYSNKLIVQSRLLYDFDFKMNKAHYDYEVIDFYIYEDTYVVTISEDDYFCFNFLNDIESINYDIETTFKFKLIDDEYKITSLYKEQGYYLMFYDNSSSVNDLEGLYNSYLKEIKNTINKEISDKQNISYTTNKTYDVKYDRNKAVDYSYKYCNLRNSEWFNYETTGGNCQNYVSQCLYYGGIPMDHIGVDQWKNYGFDDDVLINLNEEKSGRTASWIQVLYFNSYARNNKGYGLVAEELNNIYLAEIGDVVQVGYTSKENMSHSTIVSKIVDNHILVNSNSLDMKDYPIEAYTYPYRLLIKIYGYNN